MEKKIFFCMYILKEISSLDNANLRNEVLVKVGRRAACIIADLCKAVKEIHRAKQSVHKFIDISR